MENDKYNYIYEGEPLLETDKLKIEKSIDIEGEKIIKAVNIGPGADFIVILTIINSILNVFLVGEKILKGIDGWIDLGKRIKKLYQKKKLVSIDKDGASLLAIEFISQFETIISLEKINEEEIVLARLNYMLPDRKPEEFISKPYNYYIQAYLINDNKIYIVGIKSSGEINLIKSFEYGNLYGIEELGN